MILHIIYITLLVALIAQSANVGRAFADFKHEREQR